MRVLRHSSQGDHPTPGRGQAIAPTMDGMASRFVGIVGAHPCGRPAGVLSRCAILCLDKDTSILFEALISRGTKSTCLIMFGVVILF
jgi:hypothetical protein